SRWAERVTAALEQVRGEIWVGVGSQLSSPNINDFLRFTQLLQHALARDGPARHAKVLVALFKIYRIEEPAAAAPVIGTATDVSEAGCLNRPVWNADVFALVAVLGLFGVRKVAALQQQDALAARGRCSRDGYSGGTGAADADVVRALSKACRSNVKIKQHS